MKKIRRYLLEAGLVVIIGMGGACAHFHKNKYEAARETGKEVGEAVANKAYFVDQLSLLDKKQIALGKLALQKSSNTEVRAFAQQLIENHEQHMDNLEKYADASALRLAVIHLSTEEEAMGGSGGPGVLGAKAGAAKYDKKLDKEIASAKSDVQKLSAKSGPEFDKAFLEHVHGDQKHGRKLTNHGLKKYSDDAALAMLLGRSTPTFERQEAQAKALKDLIR